MSGSDSRAAEVVAVVGMAGRFPGAPDLRSFWDAVCRGQRRISDLDERRIGFVGARGVLADAHSFDRDFFGCSAREASLLDPQHRVFLETAYHALEDAGIDAGRSGAAVGVYASAAPSARPPAPSASAAEAFELELLNSPDFLATRVSYKLGLTGESVTVQTACSSSLAAVHLACESLLARRCDAALAGGVTIAAEDGGYLFEPDMIYSPDGHCRPFDHHAAGTVPGSGVAVVVLKLLEKALEDGDDVRALVLGTAMNNDGAEKLGFTAPSVGGQAEVLADALALADVPADSIGYVETHGTGTRLGDPIEFAALQQVYGAGTAPCALGSLKANYGHLDRAAGIAGFVKTVLCLRRRTIPPLGEFEEPLPELAVHGTRFTFPRERAAWCAGSSPRRAAVTSLGVGGTNVHVVLEEWPRQLAAHACGPFLLPLSARSEDALARMRTALAPRVEHAPLDRVATTLARRPAHRLRSSLVARTNAEATVLLAQPGQASESAAAPRVALLFPGGAVARVRPPTELARRVPAARLALERAAAVLEPELGPKAYALLERDEISLEATDMAHPLLVALQCALAELLRAAGVTAVATLGHSLGEIAAAVAADVLPVEDALRFATERWRATARTGDGRMLVVAADVDAVGAYLGDRCELAVVNAPDRCVVSGPCAEVERLAQRLERRGIVARPLPGHVAYHSSLLDPVLPALERAASALQPRPPTATWISSATAAPAGPDELEPSHWVRAARRPVQFSRALARLFELEVDVVVEVGAGTVLTRLVNLNGGSSIAVPLLPGEDDSAVEVLNALGSLWCTGVDLAWDALLPQRRPQPVALPRYPFTREIFHPPATPERLGGRDAGPETWLREQVWKPAPATASGGSPHRVTVLGAGPSAVAVASALGAGAALVPSLERLSPQNLDSATDLVDVRGVDAAPDAAAPEAVERMAALAAAVAGRSALRCWCVSRAGRSLAPDEPCAPAAAAVAPLVVVARQELPELTWTAVDVGADDSAAAIAHALANELTGGTAPVEVAYRDGERYLPGFRQAAAASRLRRIVGGATYVVLGGGVLGTAAAHALARNGAGTVVVATRRGGVCADGSVVHMRCDAADPDSVATLLAAVSSRYGRARGLVHAAGSIDPSEFMPLARPGTSGAHADLWRAKLGATSLPDVTAGLGLDFVLLCSSLSVAVGGRRFGAYAAANAVLDAVAASRYAGGDRAWLAVDWPEIGGDGLSEDDVVALLPRVLAVPAARVLVTHEDPEVRLTVPSSAPAARPDAALPPAADGPVAAIVADVLGEPVTDAETSLLDLGADSLMMMQIAARLTKTLGVALTLADVFAAGSVRGLERVCRQQEARVA